MATKEEDALLDAAMQRIEEKRGAIQARRARGEIGDLVAGVAARLEAVVKAARRSTRRQGESKPDPKDGR